MAEKIVTYKSSHAQLSIARVVDGKRATIHFAPHGKHAHGKHAHGEFATSDAATQKFIEKLESFRTGVISIKPESEILADHESAEADRKHHEPAAAKARAHYEKVNSKKVEARKATAASDASAAEANHKAHAKKVAEADAIKHKPHLAVPAAAPAKQAAAK